MKVVLIKIVSELAGWMAYFTLIWCGVVLLWLAMNIIDPQPLIVRKGDPLKVLTPNKPIELEFVIPTKGVPLPRPRPKSFGSFYENFRASTNVEDQR